MEMTRRWKRHQLREDTGWEPGEDFREGALLDAWGLPIGSDEIGADLTPETQLTICDNCGELTTVGDRTICFAELIA